MIVVQPDRQDRQPLSDNYRIRPRFKPGSCAQIVTPTSHCVGRWRSGSKRGIGLTKDIQHFKVHIEMLHGDQIDSRNADLLLQQGRTFGNKRLPSLRAILVGRADELNRGDQFSPSLLVKNQHFVFVDFCWVQLQSQRRLRRYPDFVAAPVPDELAPDSCSPPTSNVQTSTSKFFPRCTRGSAV